MIMMCNESNDGNVIDENDEVMMINDGMDCNDGNE